MSTTATPIAPKTAKLADLKQCERILSMRPTNPIFVSRYRQAMRAGAKFPPLIIDKTGRIIGGNHRYEAYLAEYGKEHEVEVIVRKFANEVERIEEAIRDNANHGNALDGITRKRAAIILAELGRSPETIGQLLGVSVKRLEEMCGMSVLVIGTNGQTQRQPLKRGLEHIAGTEVTAEQYAKHRTTDRGVPVVQSALQIIRWIENDWIDWTNEETRAALCDLHAAIAKKI